jgi:hypothetical protein
MPWVDGQADCIVSYNGIVYVGGVFNTVQGGYPRRNLAAFDAVTGFLLPWNPDPDGEVRCLTVTTDIYAQTCVIAGGSFQTIGGQSESGLAAVNTSGVLLPWDPGLNSGADVECLALTGTAGRQSLVFGGLFNVSGFKNAASVGTSVISYPGGAIYGPWNPSPNGRVWCAVTTTANTWILGGEFSSVGITPRNHLAEVDNGYGSVQPFNPGIGDPSSAMVVRSVVSQNGILYLGGVFPSVGGGTVGVGNSAAVTWPQGKIVAWSPNANGMVTQLFPWNGLILSAGAYTGIGGVGPTSFAALLPVATVATAVADVSPTWTFTNSPTYTISPTFSVSPTITPSPSITPTRTPSPTFSASPTPTPSPTNTACPYGVIEQWQLGSDASVGNTITAQATSADNLYFSSNSATASTCVSYPWETQAAYLQGDVEISTTMTAMPFMAPLSNTATMSFDIHAEIVDLSSNRTILYITSTAGVFDFRVLSNGGLQISLYSGSYDGEFVTDSTGDISQGFCYDLGFSYDAGVGTFFVNGAPLGTVSTSTPTSLFAGGVVGMILGFSPGSGFILNGTLSDFTISNAANTIFPIPFCDLNPNPPTATPSITDTSTPTYTPTPTPTDTP